MSGVALASAFEQDGIETVTIERRPLVTHVGRRPFPILDLRTRDESVYESIPGHHAFPKHRRFLEDQYASDHRLKEDPIFRAGPVTLFRGSVWFQGEPVRGSVHAKREADLAGWREKIQALQGNPRVPHYPGTSAVVQAPGGRNYFHWSVEVAPRLFALREYLRQGAGPLDRILLLYEPPPRFVQETLEFLYPDLAHLVEYAVRGSMHTMDSCLFFTDQKSYEDHHSRVKTTTAFLSEEIERLLPTMPPRVGRGRAILISRADAPTRRIVNEEILLDAFADHGLERVEFSALHVREQAAVMAQAGLIIGAHGAGLTNSMFCRPGTAMVEITTTQYIRRCRSFADIAMQRGLPYALAVVDQHGENWVIQQNRGNDMEIAASAVPTLRETVASLMARGGTA